MFVLIAGGIILAFFVLMVMKQKGISEQGLETTIAVDLDAIFTGAQVSEGTATKIPLPRLEINVGCDGYRVGSVSRSLDSNLIFSPNLLKGRNLITWSKSWNYPFKAENFLYLTTDEVRYILACDSDCDEIKALNSSLPEEMNKEVCKDCFSDLEDLNNYKVRFVFYDDAVKSEIISALDKFDDADYVDLENFKYKDEQEIKLDSDNDELIYAAIFAENKEHFDCMMTQAMERLKIASELTYDRYKDLKDSKCAFWSETKFKLFQDGIDNCISDYDECKYSSELKPNTFGSSRTTIQGNNEFLRKLSCPMIY